MSPWRLMKRMGWFGTSLPSGKLCHAVPHAREPQPLQGKRHPSCGAGAGTLPASCPQCLSAALPEHHPQGALEKKANIFASILQETVRGHGSSINIQGRSSRLSEPPILSMGAHTAPPHTLLLSSLQRRILHFSAWETPFFLRSSMFVISMNW